jgi:hypothetical protein
MPGREAGRHADEKNQQHAVNVHTSIVRYDAGPLQSDPNEESYGMVAVFKDLYGNRWDLLRPRHLP